MDFAAICVAILLWLVRPQDWLSGFAGVGFMSYAMLAALAGMWMRRGGLHWRMFFQSPADYVMVAYLGWIIWTTGSYFDTFKAMLPFAAFYYATALTLNTPKRLQTFLGCWVAGLCVVTIFALSTEYGLELAAGSEKLREYFEGRLALNTWIYNNPNSLGHGVVALIALSYAWLWWKRSFFCRLLAVLAVAGAGYCVFLTQSKGAYLCGAAAFAVAVLFRKKLVVQILAVTLALTAGLAALKTLPRMENLSAQEDGIAGRLIIWQMAHNAMVETDTGEGWKKFEAWITVPKLGTIRKATHGSYVNVGADLGYPGLFLFLAILCVNARTLLQARPPPEDEMSNRSQKTLLALLSCYALSAWIIDRAYHTDFFFIAGAIAAFHRQMTGRFETEAAAAEPAVVSERPAPAPLRLPIPQILALPTPSLAFESAAMSGSGSALIEPNLTERHEPSARISARSDEPEKKEKTYLSWRRLGLLDLAFVFIVFRLTLYMWAEIMTNFISF